MREGLWVVEGVNDYGEGAGINVVLIVELKDGKWWRDIRYYAEPFDAPEWRARSGRADGVCRRQGRLRHYAGIADRAATGLRARRDDPNVSEPRGVHPSCVSYV